MKEDKEDFCKLVRKDVVGGSTVDKIINCPWEDVNLVLEDWKQIMANYKSLSIEIFINFLSEYPHYRALFPSFVNVPEDDLPRNADFRIHAYAVLRGINSVMMNLSGEYEEENEILPIVGKMHNKRGITKQMMNELKDQVILSCCQFLKSNKKSRASWSVVIDYIFQDYLLRDYPVEEERVEEEHVMQ